MTVPQFIDSHCHLDFAEFDHDRNTVLANADKAGVRKIIVPSVNQADWGRTIRLCQTTSSCYLALGLHPLFIQQHQPQHLVELEQLALRHRPVAIGEIGLDFYHKSRNREKENREKQLLFFSKQLIIAKRLGLPAIIHIRKAHDECLVQLTQLGFHNGIIHAFNGSIQQAEKYIEKGFLLGFGGMLTYARSNKLRKLAETIPLQSIVLETDAPDMTVSQHRGARNSPQYIPLIAQALADIKSISAEKVAQVTSANLGAMLARVTDQDTKTNEPGVESPTADI